MTGGKVRQEQPVEPVVELPQWTLNASDTCDQQQCGARAYWRFVFPDWSELTFCGHHGAKHEAHLATTTGVFDERAQLDVKPDASA